MHFFLLLWLASLVATQHLKIIPDEVRSLYKPRLIPQNSAIQMFLQRHQNVTYDGTNAGLNCTDFNITDSNNPLTQYLQYSGVSINDFGYFDSCKNIQTNETMMARSPPLYVLYEIPFFGYPAKWGVCMPQKCFYDITTTLNARVEESLQTPIFVMNYNTMNDYDLSGWKSVLMLCILVLFILLGLIGSLIEHTQIGDKVQFKDQPLLDESSNASHLVTNLQSTVTGHAINGTAINGTWQRSQASSVPPSSNESTVPQRPRQSDPFEMKENWAKFLMCFSVSLNLKKFVTRGRDASPLDVLDGVRVLSIFWVILGHSYFYPIAEGNSIRNITDISQFLKEFLFMVVTSGLLAVDTFFFMSAFLGAYIFLVKSPKQFSPRMLIEVPIAYFHRYYRLTPLLAFIIYFGAYVIYPLGSGPLGTETADFTRRCDSYGWADLLYINNFYPKNSEVCEGQTWYLANDMQLFLLLPWLMICYRVHKLLGQAVIGACLVANLIVSFYIAWHYNLGIGLTEPDNFFDVFYDKPWVRATPYLVGILAGIVYYEYKEELKRAKQESTSSELRFKGSCIYSLFDIATRSTFFSLLYFIVGLGITFTCVFVYYPYQKKGQDVEAWPLGARSSYNMLARGMFVFGLFLLLVPLLAGRFTLLTQFLSNSLFHVMAKATYAVYLIHEILLVVFGYSERSYKYFTHIDAIVTCLSMIVFAYLVGSVFTLLIDSPLGNIDKTFLFPPKKKTNSQKIHS